MVDFRELFESFSDIKVGVIGDVMLDTYIWGDVDRISPEAPVPIVSLHKKNYRVGGAGNVALNLKSLGAEVGVLSVLGNDEEASILSGLFEEADIRTGYLVHSADRITTSKTRIISRNQQMMRLDYEITRDLNKDDSEKLLDKIRAYLSREKPDIVVFEDYNKGVLTEKIIHDVIAHCRNFGVLTAVDPKRKNFFSYKNVDIFKPNLKEVKEGLNLTMDDIRKSSLDKVHRELTAVLQHNISFITLSDKGVFYRQGQRSAVIPSHLRNIADVSGAGDTVIAVAALTYAARKNAHLMAEISNIAGGLVCEEVGTVAIEKDRLMYECELLLS